MLNGGYWTNFKKFYDEYYEKEFKSITISDEGLEYINEIIDGAATFIDLDSPYDPEEVEVWIEDTKGIIMDEDEDGETETLDLFPHIEYYDDHTMEIASFFFNRDLNTFKDKILNGDMAYVNEAIRLEWDAMLSLNPLLKDVFYF